ncbi:hypothetical protein DSN97_04550 [Deferribacteraceae bacterium V6Fe1]|nr:hypothetical protein DSN97_04550 [Deferribacteraceae bacterium V6Fe1]
MFATNNLSCAGERTNETLNCNAGEFTTIVDILTNGDSTTCIEGQSTTIDIIVTLKDNKAKRYDIGFFVGENNNDPRLQTGSCSVATFDSSKSNSDSWIDIDGDSCSDFEKNGNSTVKVSNVVVSCTDGNSDGTLDIPYTVTYQQNDKKTCNGPNNVSNAKKSKCNYGSASINNIIVIPKPIADYYFDECSWDNDLSTFEVEDSGSNSYDGTSVNGPITVDNDTAGGSIGRVGYFDGVDDYIEIPQAAADILKGTASLSFWIKTSQTGSDTDWKAPGIIGTEVAGSVDDIFWGWIDASGHIGVSKGDNYNNSKSTKPINDNIWHHVVLTRDANNGNIKIYIDGVLDKSGQTDSGLIGNSFKYIGSIYDTAGTHTFFQGYLDEVKIYDKILTDSQVQSIYNNEKAGKNWDGTDRVPPCCCVPENGNLIANPSFETLCNSNIIKTFNNIEGGTVHHRKNVCGWNVANKSYIIETWENTTKKPASDGVVFAEIDGNGGDVDRIWQILQTEPGKQYTIEFDYKKRDSSHKDNVTVTWNGEVVLSIPDSMFSVSEWKTASITVTGTGSDNFTIGETQDADDSYGSWIDNIRVVESSGYKYLLIDSSPTALTCQPTDVKITACVNDDCSQKYTNGVIDITLSADSGAGWLTNPVSISNGDSFITTGLKKTEPGQTTLSITSANPTPTDTPIYKCSWDPNCVVTFYDSGFIFDIADTYSYKPQDVTIKAVRKDDQTQACIPAFQNTSLDVNFTFDNLSANPTNTAPEIDNITLSNKITLNFDNNGTATFNVIYKEAGKLSFTATYDNGSVYAVGSDTAVFKPFGYYVYTSDNDSQADNGANSTVFKKAGEEFKLSAKAVGWQSDTDTDLSNNPVTKNYSEKNISVTHTLVEPSGGNNGTIGVTSLDFTDGEASIDNQTFSEVGIITFTVTDDDYFGAGPISGTSANIGRFIPYNFVIDNINNGTLANQSGNFNYVGQTTTYQDALRPTFIIRAVNKDNQTTTNYRGDYFKLDANEITLNYPATDNQTKGIDGNYLPITFDKASLTLVKGNGTGEVTFGYDNVTYDRNVNTLVNPFTPNFSIEITNANDGELSTDFVDKRVNVTGSTMYFGRLNIHNAYGSELDNVTAEVVTEYYDGSNWKIIEDNTTSVEIGHFILDNFTDNLNSGETTIVGVNSISRGVGEVTLSAPGENNEGSVDLSLDISTAPYYNWLNDIFDNESRGTVTFGIYRGRDRIIDWQEVPAR